MPTTIQEQLLAGIHQLEKQVTRLPESDDRTALALDLDAYLSEVRKADDDDAIAVVFPKLTQLAMRLVGLQGRK